MPTALELGHEGWEQYIKAALESRPSLPELSPSEKNERKRLLERIHKAADALKIRFKVRRVILFGSLAHKGWYRPNSDVDLAVEGLIGNDYWQAWRFVEEIINDRSIDLIDLHTAGDSLQRAIQRNGIEL